MNFKNWLLSEEIWQNNTATVYHRTRPESIATILSTNWKTAEGCMYGCGLYTTFSIESQFNSYMENHYGTAILKFKVTNLDQYVICLKSVAQQILGKNYKISDQLNRLNLTDLYTPQQINQFNQMMETTNFSSELALKMYKTNKNLENKAKGIIYYGSKDGYCLVKYPPIEDGTITLLGYANYAPTDDLQKMEELRSNCKKNEQGKCESPWITSTSKVALKTLYGLDKDKKPEYAKQITTSFSEILNMQKIDQDNWNLVKEKLQDSKKRDQIIKFIIKKNKLKINDNITRDLLLLAENKDEIAKLLGSENISKLSDNSVDELIFYSENKDEMAKLILQYKKELTDRNVSILLDSATNPDEIAKLILQHKKELIKDDVFNLLLYAKNPDEIAKLILQHKKELTDSDVFSLLLYAKNKEEIAKLLGSENINKLSLDKYSSQIGDEIAKLILQYKKDLTDSDVYRLLSRLKNKDEIAKLLGSENINTKNI